MGIKPLEARIVLYLIEHITTPIEAVWYLRYDLKILTTLKVW